MINKDHPSKYPKILNLINNIKSTFLPLIIFVLLFLAYFDENVHEFLEGELAFHMIFEHLLFFLMGAFSVKLSENILKIFVRHSRKKNYTSSKYDQKFKNIIFLVSISWSSTLRSIFKFKELGFIWISISIVLLILWHIPFLFDYAQSNENIHKLQHLSFILVGASAYLALRYFGDSFKILLLIILISMMGSMGIIFSLVDYQIFSVYSVSSHNFAGVYMVTISLMLLGLGLPFYIIKKTIKYLRSKT